MRPVSDHDVPLAPLTQRHHPTSSTSRPSKRHSSRDTADSSAPNPAARQYEPGNEHGNRQLGHDAQPRRRSHKPRPSAGFLLSNPLLDESPQMTSDARRRSRAPIDNRKWKRTSVASDNSTSAAPSNAGLGVETRDMSSPDATRYSASSGEERRDGQAMGLPSKVPYLPSQAAPLDQDATQIVNMALNLNESRRLASRRNISNSIPPRLAPLPDSPAGGSLKQHLQQQRRDSRNISPRPEKALARRNISGAPISSPLQAVFDQDGSYLYHFSPSTLNRAQKAREYLELMAQHRRLLQFLPPLDEDVPSRPSTSSLSASPVSATSTPNAISGPHQRTFGRSYNPLQYIRNRKIRARERRAIDGETQGFSDISKVTGWVDEVAASAVNPASLPTSSTLPHFQGAQEELEQQLPRPSSSAGKPKRPRNDWSIDPADMLADVYWLEQQDNKHLIEDRHYSKIFPQKAADAHRPPFPPVQSFERPALPTPAAQDPQPGAGRTRPSLDLDIPKATKVDVDNPFSSTRDRARQKLHELRNIHHKQDGSAQGHHEFFKFRKSSFSDTSDSEIDRKRRDRQGTISANRNDLFERQMMDMLANESMEKNENPKNAETGGVVPFSANEATPGGPSQTTLQQEPGGSDSRIEVADNQGQVERGRVLQASPIGSGRTSLEVPGYSRHGASLDLDSSRPVSPDTRSLRRRSNYLPIIGMDLSPPSSRPRSPERNPFSKVKSIFRDRSRERGEHADSETGDRLDSPLEPTERFDLSAISTGGIPTPERQRSKSPTRHIISRDTGETSKSHRSMGSMKLKSEEQLGLKAIFKGGAKIDGIIRGGVSKVTDLIWKKEGDSEDTSATSSSDDSDGEQTRGRFRRSITLSRGNSRGREGREGREGRHAKNYLDVMPPFKPAWDSPDKSTTQEADTLLTHVVSNPSTRSQRFDQLKPPRIDIRRASPSSSELERLHDLTTSYSESHPYNANAYIERPRQSSRELNNVLSIPPARVARQRPSQSSLSQPPSGRHWSISDRDVSPHRAQISKRDIARLRTLILCSGIKAMEISRRAHEPHPLFALDNKTRGLPWTDVSSFAPDEKISLVAPQTEMYPVTTRMLSDSIEGSLQTFENTAAKFSSETSPDLQRRTGNLEGRVATDLIDRTRRAADEADEVSHDLVDSQRLKVQSVVDTMDKMLRRRRRRFRWARRAGWLAVEWVLVGFMWYVWFVVMIARIFLGIGRGVVGVVRWLLWL
ncbi:hypothetical protein F4778DRAFT_325927 [Xylariomycetidae sp. FL2044]|nr:hypothetical protein F4778DRAFT_325927 [Xylariomycetidae sp. FL2044]